MTHSQPTRRDFIRTSSVAAASAALATSLLPQNLYAKGDDEIKVGLIGCGGRGTGAIDNVLHSAPNVRIVALADAFQDRAESCEKRANEIAGQKEVQDLGNKVDVKGRVFWGLKAFEDLLKCDINYVMLATPPGFRPIHLAAAVAAGKNIFTEKPVAVDGPGIRSVFDSYDAATKKNLAIVAGTQRRHQLGYLTTMQLLKDGAIGDLVGGRGYWNQGVLWCRPRQKEWSDLEYQMRNWYNFTWICGDHIVEQHVHNLDVLNWGFGAHPLRAVGMGGRQRSVPNPHDFGQIFDHFAVDYEYPKGVHALSECRQIDGCENSVSEAFVGTKGTCQANEYKINGNRVVTRDQDKKSVDPYIQEHTDLIESIRSGKPLNELKQVGESTLTAIMGRMSTYTGQAITWEQALNSKEELMPRDLDWKMSLAEPAVAVPGKTKFS
jgi:myo-inositol 2-dehydrogenase / D-chiro-inositol 1-dehydrogenase